MARFHVILGSGEKITIEADTVDNVPEFVREIKDKSYVTGRMNNGQAVALVDPHVAVVELV